MPELIQDFPSVPVDPTITTVSDKEANEQAFYATSISGVEDPVQQFEKSRYNLKTTGEDDLVKSVNDKWKQEQDTTNKQVISDILADQSIPKQQKYQVLQGYALSGFLSTDIRDKYIQKIAAKDVSTSQEDSSAQQIVIDELQKRDKIALEVEKEITKYGSNLDPSATKAFIGLVAEFLPLESIRVGQLWKEFAGGEKATTFDSVMKGFFGRGQTKEELRNVYNKLPLEKKPEFIRKFADTLKDLPGFDSGKYTQFIETIESQEPTSPFWKNFDSAIGLLDVVGIGYVVKHPVKTVRWFKPELQIKPRSPAGTTATANPEAAAQLGATIVADNTERMAKATNNSAGSFIHSWVFPKTLESELQYVPNLSKEIEVMDDAVLHILEETKFNPALINATEAKATADRIQNVLQEVGLPIYNQGASTLRNISPDDVFKTSATIHNYEGLATFGRTKNYGYTTQEGATKALSKLEEKLKGLPEAERGKAEIVYWDEDRGFQKILGPLPEDVAKQYFIQWKWNKEIDKSDLLVFGEKSIETKVRIPFLGKELDVSAIARNTRNYLFPDYDRVKPWVYKGAVHSELMERLLDRSLLKPILDNVSKNPHGKEIGQLLDEGNRIVTPTGGKVFTFAEVADRFPKLSMKQTQELYKGYAVARRVADYHWVFANRLDYARKAASKYEAIYDAENALVNYGRLVTKGELGTARTVVDLSDNSIKRITDELLSSNKIVQLDNKFSVGTEKFEYALLGAEHKLGGLPTTTLPYRTGYMPRMYKQFYWVDVVPKELRVNGELITDKRKIDEFKESIRSTKTESEANDIAQKFMKDNPEYAASVRRDRLDRQDRALEEYQVYSNAHSRARMRGDHILDYEGQLADTEDPLVALIKSIRGVAHRAAFSDFRQIFEDTFTKEYREFLQGGKFPKYLSDISGGEHMDIAASTKYKEAVENYKYYADINDITDTVTDRLWKETMYSISEVLDDKVKWLPEVLKESSRKGALPVRALQKAGTVLFIFTNPIRQAVIQTQQLWDLALLTPSAFKDITVTNIALMGRLASEKLGGTVGEITRNAAVRQAQVAGYSKEEFEDLFQAYKLSGIPYSVDSHMVLHGMFDEADKPLNLAKRDRTADFMQTITGTKLAKATVRVGKLGFDAGEFTNMTGSWLWARQRWINMNPKMDWKSAEARAEIGIMARNISGSMSKTGSLGYQQGIAAIPFQFAAIGHKLFLQPLTSKYLTSAEKGRLLAARTIWYGAYGTGLGGLAEMLQNKFYDAEYADIWDFAMGGLSDWSWNNFIDNSLGPDGNELSISPGITPVPKFGLPYFDFLHSIIDQGADGFYSKVPLVNIYGKYDQMLYDLSFAFGQEDITNVQQAQIIADSVLTLSSGYSNYMKFQMIMESQKLVDKFGNDYGFQAGLKTGIGRLLGFQTKEEEALFAVSKFKFDRDKDLQKDAKQFHNSLEKYMRTKGNFEDTREYIKQETQIIRMLPEEDKAQFRQYFKAEDTKSFKERNMSVLTEISKAYRTESNSRLNTAINRLAGTNNPKAQEFLEFFKNEQVIE